MDNEEANALIAEKIMGWHKVEEQGFGGFGFVWRDEHGHKRGTINWSPSSDVSAAFLVVEKLKQDGYFFEMRSGDGDQLYYVSFAKGEYVPYDDFWTEEYTGSHAVAAMAICLAALDTKGIEVEAN